ncbi:hypothetical protein ES707_04339 [subsurface metagenome]
MTGTRITICIICGIIGLATWTMASAKQPATKTGKSELRVGTFDSRALAIAYYRSEAFDRYLKGQEGADTQETESQRIYRRAYEAAAADGVISPDELQILKSLQQTLGLHEDIIDEALGETLHPLPPGPEQSGRWTLVAQNMGWGMGLYGLGIPHVLDLEDKWYIGGEMLSLGATFYLTWKYTENMDLPEARSQLQRYGGVVGLQYGRALNSLLGYWDNDSLDRGEVAVLMGAVPVGVFLGDRLYQRWRPANGMAYALSLYAGLGSSIMRTLHQQIAPEPKEDEEDELSEEPETAAHIKWRKQRLMFDIAGYPLGTFLGHKLYGGRQYTFGDAMLLIVGWATGSFYGAMVSDIFGLKVDEHDTAILWMVTAGGLGGVWATDRFIKGYDYTFGQTALVGLGSIAGGAFAFGLGIIADVDFDSKYYEVATIGGNLAGFFLIRRIINPRLELATAGRSGKQPQLNLSLQPAMVGGAVLPTLSFEARW